jgi:vacuole membrane protein 1
MIKFMKRWGFWGVFVMSAWPNALFDLCGICCGTCLMPFWHFFSACFLGKACVKAPAQLVVLVLLFSETYRDKYVSAAKGFVTAIPAVGEGMAIKLQQGVDRLRETAEKGEQGESGEQAGGFGASDIFAGAIGLVIATFALSCIEQFAQAQQRSYDENALAAAGIQTKSRYSQVKKKKL